ncbi:MAG: SDR family NAD(P)-dependent oxidoreductase [Candidatus Anammoxibacter sp.]
MKQNNINAENKPISTPIAVIGMSCIFPKAANLADYWSNIKNGTDCITDVPSTHWQKEDYFDNDPKKPDSTYAARGGFIDPVDFDPLEFGITPNAVEATDTSQLLGLVVAKQALQDAGYWENKEFDRDRVSVILGVTGTLELVIPLGARLSHPAWRKALKEAGVDDNVADDVVQRISDSYVDWQENSFPGLLGNVAAGRIANRLDLHGTNCVVDAACASSLSALHMASLELSAGRTDMVITGGLDTFNDIFMYMCFSKTMVLSPTGDARPFDHKSDGTILGEGLGMMVIKRLDDAERDNDNIYAVIRGVGTSSDGIGNPVYVPSSIGQARAIANAYEQADITPGTVELVEAHGTGTKIGDASEVTALTDVYNAHRNDGTWCALGSVKSQIGHTKAAAGIAGLIKVIMALRNKVLPPTIKVENPIEAITENETPFYINTQARPWLSANGNSRRAAVSAFGFGGSNFHCVVEEYDKEKKGVDWDSNIEILCLSNNELPALKESLKSVAENFSWKKLGEQAAASRVVFSSKHTYRLIAVIEKEKGDTKNALNNALEMLEKEDQESEDQKKSWNTPDGIHFSCRDVKGKLGIVFSGQGSQYVGMQRELSCQFPQMQKVLTESNSMFSKSNGTSCHKNLTDYIYPVPSFDPAAQKINEELLKNTEIAQPAIGAVSIGMYHILTHFGISPDALAGHSYGELTALCAASCFDTQTFYNLSRVRGELMAESNGKPGAMTAVWSDSATMDDIIQKEAVDLVIANKNTPKQTVLSGALGEIEKIEQIFTNLKIRYKRLAVSSAFHSPLVSKAVAPFHKALVESDFGSLKTPVFANRTAEQYPDDPDNARKILSEQLISPVEFVKQIENMYESGVSTFVEVGPGNKLAGLVKAILNDKECEVFSLDASSGKRSGIYDLASTLAHLAVSGFSVDLAKWNEGLNTVDISLDKDAKKPSMILSICGSNYVKPKEKRQPKPPLTVTEPKGIPIDKPVESDYNKGGSKASVGLKQTKSASVSKISGFDKSAIKEMYRITNENMITLQKVQEQTAKLHQKFLENQDTSLRSLTEIMEQQRQLIGLSGTETLKYVTPELKTTEKPSSCTVETLRQKVEPNKVTKEPEPIESEPVTQNRTKSKPTISSETNHVREILLDVVSEKTGYPIEMLELDMSLDSDLGIDSIKRVEILSALQGKLPEAPEVKPEHMGVLNTLRQIVDFLSKGNGTVIDKQEDKAIVGNNVNQVQEILLNVVSEKTGYPIEMLELDMSLDSDLGIDSIKRVEILSALQGKLPEAPEVKPEHMGVLNTLRQIVDFLSDGNGTVIDEQEDKAIVGNNVNQVQEILLDVVSEKTGYPIEMLELDMSLDSDPGIDSIKRVEILSALQGKLPEAPEVKPEHMGVLNTLRQIVDFLTESQDDVKTVSVSVDRNDEELRNDNNEQNEINSIERSVLCPVSLNGNGKDRTFAIKEGTTILITDDNTNLSEEIKTRLQELNYKPVIVHVKDSKTIKDVEHVGGLIIIAPADPVDCGFLKSAFELLRSVAPGLRSSGKNDGALFVTVTRLDGEFGLNGLMPKSYPISGGLAGLSKTAQHEWPEVHCKALDVSSNLANSKQTAAMIIEEVFTEGLIEVGISKNGRNSLTLKLQSISGKDVTRITNEDVIIVAGGARGVTAEVSLALAKAFKPVLVLLGRSKYPEKEPDWMASLTNETDLKRAIITHSDKQLLPKLVEDRYKSLIANREILNNIAKIEGFGSQVLYHSVDIRDAGSVEALILGVRKKFGAINGLIHGAGVIADRIIEEKTSEQFDAVYTTKVAGLLNLLNVLQHEELKFIALFSSFTGRYGRVGQVDYAVANEVLNKIAQQQSRLRPSCRVVSVNWGPWDGGMVTPALKKIFRNENVDLIEPEMGANYLIDEICANVNEPVEVVVMGGNGNGKHHEIKDDNIGLQDNLSVAFEIELNTKLHPFLNSHVIDNRAVLPMAMIIEWAAHAALHLNPGLVFCGFNDFRLLKGVTLGKTESCNLIFLAGKAVSKNDAYLVPVELQSVGANGIPIVHARTQILLGERIPDNGLSGLADIKGKYNRDFDEIYEEILFHGKEFQGIEQIDNYGEEGISASVRSAPTPNEWIKTPLRNRWLADPLMFDCSFQLMILWCFEEYQSGSLPCFIGQYRQYKRALPTDGMRVVVHVKESNTNSAIADIDFIDNNGKCVAQIKDYESVISTSLNSSFQKNRLSDKMPQVAVC